MMKKIICILLSILTLFSVSACATSNVETPSESNDSIMEEVTDENGDTVNIISKGKSDYEIVIPNDATKAESYAAEEIQLYLKEATLCELKIVQESAAVDADGKHLYIGETQKLASSGITVDYDELGEGGIIIKRIENSVFITGATQDAIMFAAYQFLKNAIGFVAYATDEVYFDYKSEVQLLDFNIKYLPSIDSRLVGFSCFNGIDKLQEASKMYLISGTNGGYNYNGALFGGLFSHTIDNNFFGKGSEFYKPGGQICMSDEAAIEHLFNGLKSYLTSTKSPYVMIGHGDNTSCCACNECQKVASKYGYGGLFVQFLNKVGEKVETYLTENEIDRNLTIIGLAYQSVESAPAVVENGVYKPMDESVRCRDNVGIMFAPLYACYNHGFADKNCGDDSDNSGVEKNIRGWAAVTDCLQLWLYGTNFSNYMLYFDDFNSYVSNAELFTELGVKHAFIQTNAQNTYSPFMALRSYLISQLWWDSTQSFEDLFNSFMANYYKAASNEMISFYTAIREQWMKIYSERGSDRSGIYDAATDKEWDVVTLNNLLQILDRALTKVKNSELTDAQKEKVLLRIRVEEAFIRYTKFSYHPDYYSELEYEQERLYLRNFMAENGINYSKEGGALSI